MKLILMLFILTFLSLPAVVNAVNPTTVGSVTLVSTFKSIGVYSNYTGDDNNNSIATLEYKEKSAIDWKQGHPLYIDRGVWLRSEGRYTNRQGKGSIVMLQPNTEYDVKVTYTDPDGVSGTNPVTASIRTRDESSPTGTGNSYYVATTGSDTNSGTESQPFRTIQKAVSLLQAGNTIYIKAGTYNETISMGYGNTPSGTASNYITIRNYGNDEVIIDGGCNRTNNVLLGTTRGYIHGGNYIRITGLIFKNANAAAISLDDVPGIWIENNQMIDFNCADLGGQQYGAVGAMDTTNLVIRNNIIRRNVGGPPTGCNVIPPATDAIWIKNNGFGRGGGHIIYNNKISGNFRDGVGGEPEGPSYGSLYKDTDIYNNEVTGCADDGIQADSGGINIRIWNNTIRNCLCSGFSFSPASEGPLYIFRNTISGLLVNGGIAGYKQGSAGNGRAYLYHNSAFVWNGNTYGGGAPETNVVFKNNVMSAGRYAYENPSYPPYDFDYNVLYETDPNRFIYWQYINYYTLLSFQNATGQDLNSINADPRFIDQTNGDLRLQSSSPAIDNGTIIPNFNDQESAWPYRGTAPDIGAVEYDSGVPTFNFNIATNPSAGAVIQGGSTITTVTSTLTSGSTQSVSLTSTISPNEPTITKTFSTNSGNPTYTSTLTIATASNTPAGTYTITVTGTGGSLTRTTSYSLTVSSTADTTPPVRSNGQPTGTLAAGTTQTTISLTTNEVATCRYSITSGIAYDFMTNTFTTTGDTSHSSTVTVTSGNSYNYYVKCSDAVSNKNPDDFTISFSVASATPQFNFIADVTTEETAVGMVEYLGDLYIAAHTQPMNGGPGTILRYNDLTGNYGVVFNQPASGASGQGLGDIKVLNGKIYVTNLDPSSDLLEIYIYDGVTWQTENSGGRVLRAFDIDIYQNRFYLTALEGPRGNVSAVLLSSTDAITWTVVYRVAGFPFTQMAVFNSKLFFTPGYSNQAAPMDNPYDIFSFNGSTATPIEFSTSPMTVTDIKVFNNALYLGVWDQFLNVPGMYRSVDGVNFEVVSFFGPFASRAPRLSEMVVYNNKLYVAEYLPGTAPQVAIYSSSDGTNWIQEFSIPATQSVYGNSSSYNHVALGVYRNRLYVIPPAQGRLYVLSDIPSDTTPPIISSITSAYSTVSANITWNTDDLSNSTVNYGTTTAVASTASGTSLVTSHRISVIGLLPNTTYYYRGTSCNSNNLCNSSSIRNFTTNALPPNEVCVDSDNDNFYAVSLNCTGGNDCNDANVAVNPLAAEVCGNSIDENCDNIVAGCTACPDGSIPSTGCGCGGVNYYSGYCCSNAYQTSACTQPPTPSPPSGGGGGGVVTIGNPVETPITKEPETKTTVNVSQTTGTVSLEITAPVKVESGELFNVTAWILSPVKATYTLTVGDVQQQVELDAGKEEMLIIPVRAPEARGSYTLTAEIGGTTRANDIELDYLPLFLYVTETRVGNETFVNITVKNYESMSTELRVIKDGKSDAFFELIEGKKEYRRELKLTQAGEYKIVATASSQGKVIDTDEYLLTVGGERKFDYRLIVIIVFAFVVILITLLSLVR